MTAARTRSNIILGTGDDAITVYTTRCKKTYIKTLVKINPPQSSSNWGSGVKDTKMVDLLRIEVRFTINGYVASADQSGLEALITAGGTFNMAWNSTDYEINSDKLEIIEDSSDGEQDEMGIMMTAIVGIDI